MQTAKKEAIIAVGKEKQTSRREQTSSKRS